MLDEIKQDATHRMDQAVSHTQGELNKVRTGRANPEMFNSLQVDYYGVMSPLNQVATIAVPEPRLITLQPFEKSLIPEIEKAITNANMGFTPGNNGNVVMIPIPALSEERRKDLVKYVHQLVEEGRIAIRNVRRDALHHMHDYGKEEHISEDQIHRRDDEMQKLTDEHINKLGEMQESKESEILEV
ncbi:MAG: ribosome recycling factor [Candidatus Marinimicrobia bacterium]|nr:ribosome recycling factor [Candidatus Neomarinimicrobiota bacterium]